MTGWYAPNQQAVRPDGSGPAEEGTGAGQPPTQPQAAQQQQTQPESEPQVREDKPAARAARKGR